MPTQYQDWIKAGQIASETREYSKQLIKPGTPLLEIAEKIEAKIRELGGIPGFPVNLSLNEIAAHYTPLPDDNIVLKDQVIKVDIGTCYNGAIGDTAYTIDLSGRQAELVRASEEALKNVIKMIALGTTLGQIGKTISETIESYSLKPVRNLSGHGLGPFSVHEPPSIPNYDTHDPRQIEEGMVFAIEPFATDGAGLIRESSDAMIFSQVSSKQVRSQMARQVLKDIEGYQGLPFATRWLAAKHGIGKTRLALRELRLAHIIRDYSPLPEVEGGMVSQAEHSFIVKDDKVIVTTA